MKEYFLKRRITKRNYENLCHDCFGQSEPSLIIKEKARFVNKLLPAQRVVDVGGMWRCNGFYSFIAANEGVEEVILLDCYKNDCFDKINRDFPNVKYININFYKAMLTGELTALGNKYPADGVICYNIVLHQPEPIHFIANIINSFGAKRIVFANPVIKNSEKRSDVIFAPFSNEFKRIQNNTNKIRYSKNIHEGAGWVWVFSHGFLLNCMKYLNLYIAEEKIIRNWGKAEGLKGLEYSLIKVEKK